MNNPYLLVPRVAVWRRPGVLSIGDPASPIVLEPVPKELSRVIGLLDGRHDLIDLFSVCDERWVAWLLDHMKRLGRLQEGPPATPALRLRWHGSGPLIDDLVRLARTALPAPALARTTPSFHILAQPTAEPDRVQVNDLMARGLPHLVIRVSDELARIGPLVAPGTTSCLTCEDLARRDLDPTWPLQVFQLSQITTRPSALLRAWTAATAVGQVLAWARGETPDTINTVIEWSCENGRVTYRPAPIHPACPHHADTED
ncbi:MAG: hypothetical protein LBV00_05500 [Propionibacteriaceae bacterium]|jgi:hypothetical protein|nr:hypothetical protein [Propionibacteriaceae bacterium]